MKMMRGASKLIGGLLGLAFIALPLEAEASLLQFNTSTPPLLNQPAFTVTLTGGDVPGTIGSFSNPTREFGANLFQSAGTDPGSLYVGSAQTTNTFDVSFDNTVQWVGGTIGFLFDPFLGLDIVGSGVNENGLLAGASANSLFTLSTPLTFLGGQVYSFTAVNTVVGGNIGAAAFTSWTFEAAQDIPEPSTLALFAIALGGLGFMARRRVAP